MVKPILFPPEVIELQKEIQYHPELVQKLYSTGPLESDFSSKIAIIATYCDVLVDGYYSIDDLIALCGKLCMHLKRKRTEIIVPF